jgi:hypothetical protein
LRNYRFEAYKLTELGEEVEMQGGVKKLLKNLHPAKCTMIHKEHEDDSMEAESSSCRYYQL